MNKKITIFALLNLFFHFIYVEGKNIIKEKYIILENVGETPVHLSYEDNFGEIVGAWIQQKGKLGITVDGAIRVTFDSMQELYPVILFPNDTLKVLVDKLYMISFQKKNTKQNEFYKKLDNETKILKSPFFGIEYNSKVNYDILLNEIQNTYKKRISLLSAARLNELYDNIYKELIFARYVDELQAPLYKLGYGSKMLSKLYYLELEKNVDSLIKLSNVSKFPNLIRNYLLSCVKTKVKNSSIKIIYDYTKTHLNENLKEYVQLQLLKSEKSQGKDVNEFIRIFVKESTNSEYKYYFTELDKLSLYLDTSNDSLQTNDDSKITWKSMLNMHKGRVIYIDIWASWCGPCMLEIPYSVQLEKKLQGAKVDIVYISIDSDLENWHRVANKYFSASLLTHHYQLMPTTNLAKLLTRGSIPKFLIINKFGKLVTEDASRPSQMNTITELIESSK